MPDPPPLLDYSSDPRPTRQRASKLALVALFAAAAACPCIVGVLLDLTRRWFGPHLWDARPVLFVSLPALSVALTALAHLRITLAGDRLTGRPLCTAAYVLAALWTALSSCLLTIWLL